MNKVTSALFAASESLADPAPFNEEDAFDYFKLKVRDACLDSLDTLAAAHGASIHSGWKDKELPALFVGLDVHAAALWERFGRAHAKGVK